MPKGITSLTGFVRKISSITEAKPNSTLLFRGHSKKSYKFLPSVLRSENWRKSEHLMLRQLLADAPQDFAEDRTAFDVLVRAQHYGLPTRLLDVSTNPLVGLYFACCSHAKERGQVLIVEPPIHRQKYFDSDTVSLLANLAYLRRGQKEDMLTFARDNVHSDTKPERIAEFSDCPQLDPLLQQVRQEKPYFLARVDPFDMAYVVSVVPRKSHARIAAQSGGFLVFGITEHDVGAHLSELKIDKVDIAADAKADILDQLNKVGISRRTLFPEIENAANQISQRYS
ncbi:FRG domain-containing protein [Rhodophyticola porphyridii]|uniref:FRG domain-containing protein n=1 Tax=Rhodophyticola porphyridii TaxID=1852017 RepID=A0A3L9Y4X8_9RHOB|nr:FRG domain-containing protein [Rhodophyticola porphyridii]RMA43874.1 FRG domain-containing protein [Rhodophyticola porphyridii]